MKTKKWPQQADVTKPYGGDLEVTNAHLRARLAELQVEVLTSSGRAAAAQQDARAYGLLVARLLEWRSEARASRDFATADRIRDTLVSVGYSHFTDETAVAGRKAS